MYMATRVGIGCAAGVARIGKVLVKINYVQPFNHTTAHRFNGYNALRCTYKSINAQ